MSTDVAGEVVYQRPDAIAKFDEDTGVLWVGMRTCPDNDQVDHMWTVLTTFVKNYPTRCVIHLAHVETPELPPPQLPAMIHIVTKIVTEFDDLAKKCKRLIIQPKVVDDKVMFAQQMFVGLINTKIPLEIMDDPKDVQALIRQLTKRK